MRIRESDFERMFRLGKGGFPDPAKEFIKKFDLTYRPANEEEKKEYAIYFQKLGEKGDLVRSREENYLAFERGWAENLEEFKKSSTEDFDMALKPKYYRGSKFLRYNNNLIVTDNFQLEYDLFLVARHCLFNKYLENSEIICELGSGSGANLLLLSNVATKAKIIGLDWTSASTEIARELGKRLSKPITGQVFDLLAPDFSAEIPEGAAIISIHSFEQLGQEFEPVLEFIIKAQPSIVLQYEPVMEFYEENYLLDDLAESYCKSRNYLQGYYSRLRQMESGGKIKIYAAYRPYLGGVLHESSVLVWKPL